MLFYFASILFFIWVIRSTLFWVALWQLKEYRLDRIIIHLRETTQGRSLVYSKFLLLKLVIILVWIILIFRSELILSFRLLSLGVLTYQAYLIIKEFLARSTQRPIFTLKALFVIFIVLTIISLLFFVPFMERFIWMIFLGELIPFLIAFFVLSLSFPTEIYRDWQIEKARKKISEHKNLLVIGVTGSYGKSSTKDYVAQILEKKFKVLKTRGTNNTPIGIAKTILSGLRKDTQIFVVEMGAYKKGEITEMCQIVKPKIGIITAVSEQHLSLFGSLKNVAEAKNELIEALPGNGLALFNGNSETAKKLFDKSHKKKVLYQVGPAVKNVELSITAGGIKVRPSFITFDVSVGDNKTNLSAPLIGAQNVENILPGIYIAYYLKMNDKQIKNAVSSLSPLPKVMEYHRSEDRATYIDDTFNANPQSVLAALNYMKIYKGKKILVLQPMIELGKNAKSEHYRISKEISNICDDLLLTNRNFYDSIKKGIKDGGGDCAVLSAGPQELFEFIKSETEKGDIVVFEGKEAANVLGLLL